MKSKKLLKLFLLCCMSILSYSATWKFEGGLNGDEGLMLIYKTLPPLIIEVDSPETMRVSKNIGEFTYSKVTNLKRPLNVSIKVSFNNDIIENNNAVNKEIVRTIYDTTKLSFKDNGRFYLRKTNGKLRRLDVENQIDAYAFFSTSNGEKEGDIINRGLGDTISNGTLSQNNIYINAIFNQEKKELIPGEYSGIVTLMVEFLGRGEIIK